MRASTRLTACIIVALVLPSAAFAYAVPTGASVSQSTDTFDVGNSLNQLWEPFQGFVNNLEGLTPNDLPGHVNPSTQIETQIHNGVITVILHAISWVTDWLISLADRLAVWAISLKSP